MISFYVVLGLVVVALLYLVVAAMRRDKPDKATRPSQAFAPAVDSQEYNQIPMCSLDVSLESKEKITRTGAALKRSNKERKALVGDRTGMPPTEAMLAAVKRLGFDPSGLDFEMANTLLSIRDYVFCLAQRTPQNETPAQLRALIDVLLDDSETHSEIKNWSWHTRNHEVRRIPKNALRYRCEDFLKRYR